MERRLLLLTDPPPMATTSQNANASPKSEDSQAQMERLKEEMHHDYSQDPVTLSNLARRAIYTSSYRLKEFWVESFCDRLNKKDPIILGVEVLDGILKERTPICIPAKGFMKIGRIEEIRMNDKQLNEAKKGQKVNLKIVGWDSEEKQKMVGGHFDIDDQLVSHITRQAIDILTADYQDELSVENLWLVDKLRREFNL